ncbi:MAG: SDR family oxidoreductase, partial [Bacteroidales bacterium]|nr:SDR family oxidoreductase [Bacteroidales bacterium]
AVELGGRGIRANAVLPGTIETTLGIGAIPDELIVKDKELYTLRRYGKPEEVAHSIIYLLSDAAAWVTGTSLVIDGGRLLK